MKNNLLTILKSCDIVKDLSDEFNKPLGWLKIKEKLEYKKLRKDLLDSIDKLMEDKWTVDYLNSLEYILIPYYPKLKPYMEDFYITDWNNSEKINKFKPIRITTENYMTYSIEIITNNLTFTEVNIFTGKEIQIIAGKEVSDSQKRIELICKQILIKDLKNYLDDILI